MNATLDFGQTFSKAFDIYKQRAGVLLPGAIIVFLVTAIVAGLLRVALGDGIFGQLLSNIVSYVGTFIYAGIVAQIVAGHFQSRDMSFGEAFSGVSAVFGALVGVAILGSIAINIGFLLVIIPGLFLATRWALLAPVVVLEKTEVGATFSRSNDLVKGNSWNVFGILLVLYVALFVAIILFVAIFAVIGSLVAAILAIVIALVAVAPVISLVQAVMYFELLQIKGGAVPAGSAMPTPGPAAPGPADTSGSAPPPSAPPPPSA